MAFPKTKKFYDDALNTLESYPKYSSSLDVSALFYHCAVGASPYQYKVGFQKLDENKIVYLRRNAFSSYVNRPLWTSDIASAIRFDSRDTADYNAQYYCSENRSPFKFEDRMISIFIHSKVSNFVDDINCVISQIDRHKKYPYDWELKKISLKKYAAKVVLKLPLPMVAEYYYHKNPCIALMGAFIRMRSLELKPCINSAYVS